MSTFKFEYPRVLSIAGSDSGGGAGIQADLKTFSALGCYGMTAITALTAQNTCGVRAIHGVPPNMLRDQMDAVLEDIGADAVKIGMLHSPEVVEVVAWAIDHYQLQRVVLDPVMVATSGDKLIADETVAVLVRELFPRVQLITPNLDEAALLLGRPVPTWRLCDKPVRICRPWALHRCCSRVDICKERMWWTCCCWLTLARVLCVASASAAAMCMEPVAPCLLRSPVTGRLGLI